MLQHPQKMRGLNVLTHWPFRQVSSNWPFCDKLRCFYFGLWCGIRCVLASKVLSFGLCVAQQKTRDVHVWLLECLTLQAERRVPNVRSHVHLKLKAKPSLALHFLYLLQTLKTSVEQGTGCLCGVVLLLSNFRVGLTCGNPLVFVQQLVVLKT